jgi:hypothetical protein
MLIALKLKQFLWRVCSVQSILTWSILGHVLKLARRLAFVCAERAQKQALKQTLAFCLSCVVVLSSLLVASPAQAQTVLPPLFAQAAPQEPMQTLFSKLDELLPKLGSILTEEQQEKFTDAITEGGSFRKAFKALALSPDQKTQLSELLRSVPGRGLLATLTPEQKKQLFMKKREMFAPSSAEIKDKIDSKLKAKGDFMPAGVGEKIGQKIDQKMQMVKEKTAEIQAKASEVVEEMAE